MARRRSTLLTILIALPLALVLTIGLQWYLYVTNTSSPYDEVGIALNRMMPGPVNAWGCARLHQTFGEVVPPMGCGTAEGTWN